jgi:hypothetical protein
MGGTRNTSKFLEWIRANSSSKFVAHNKVQYLMLVPDTADGFRSAIGALQTLDESQGVSSGTYSLPEDRCLRLLLKNFCKRTTESENREELKACPVTTL